MQNASGLRALFWDTSGLILTSCSLDTCADLPPPLANYTHANPFATTKDTQHLTLVCTPFLHVCIPTRCKNVFARSLPQTH